MTEETTELTTTEKAELAVEHQLAPQGVGSAVEKLEKRIKQYLGVRGLIKTMEDRHKTELKELQDIKEKLSGILQEALTNVGAESIKTTEGTIYSTTRYSASLADPKAFMDYVIKNNLYDLLDRKANVTACKDYVAEHG